MEHKDIENNIIEKDILDNIDRLFDENKPKEAECYMLDMLNKAKTQGENHIALLLLNELIGYYRQTSEKERLNEVIDESLKLADDMGLAGSITYATTTLNVANAYRSMGRLEDAGKYYSVTEGIYNDKMSIGELDKNSMHVAGLYNNISLMYQELSDYESAKKYLLKALDISKKNNAGFEIAVTYANLANTFLLGEDYYSAEKYARQAIELFNSRGLRDPHYCAALSALGSCYYESGRINKARQIFSEALAIVEETFGRNSQYERLMENIKMCDCSDNKKISGLDLSRKYYEEYGVSMIKEKFPDYEGRIAVGLVGEGSDCYGFDDEFSFDHDSGPAFCMWLTDETYDEIGEELSREYDKLPITFMGRTRNVTDTGRNRRGVMKISSFYSRLLGTHIVSDIDYANVPDYALAASVNGEVFRDDEGVFSGIRARLKAGYPANIRLVKLAEDVAGFSQCGQYNYLRMSDRKDKITAGLMLHDCIRHAMKLYHHIYNVYPPHDKWLYKSAGLLPGGSEFIMFIDNITEAYSNCDNAGSISECIEKLGEYFARILYSIGDISDIDSYIEHHTQELVFKAGISLCDDKELIERIVKLEFEAFDKVENEGGRASCQNNWPTFYIMRKSQYLTWNRSMLIQYLYDFTREYNKGHNLITEKYGRMMESTAPDRYEEIKQNFPELSDEKKAVIEQIVKLQMTMADEFALEHPEVAGNARSLHTYEDNFNNTSYETYLRGEISTYSDKMLQLYGQFVVKLAKEGHNLALMTIENTARLYGYKDIYEFENRID